MPAKGRYLLTAFIFFCCQSLAAQEFPFIQYTPKDGLVNSRVRKVTQDSKGRMYFLTYGGLSVYDGVRFKNYTKENGLAVDMVNDILELGNDSFLVSTNTNRLNILVAGEMKTFSTADNFYPVVNNFLKSNDGNIYVTTDQGLYILNGNKFEHLDFSMRIHEQWPPFLGTITEWKDYLIFTTNDLRNHTGLYLFNKKKKVIVDAIPGEIIASMGKDKSGNIWISLNNRIIRLDSFSLKDGKIKFEPPVSLYSQLTNFPGSSMAFDNHNAWVIHNTKEIIRVGDDRSFLRFRLPGQYAVFDITSIFIDRENIVWICSEGGGLIKLAGTGFRVQQPVFNKNQKGIIYNVAYFPDTTWLCLNSQTMLRKIKTDYRKYATNLLTNVYLLGQPGGKLIASDENYIYEASIPTAEKNHIVFKKIYGSTSTNPIVTKNLVDPFGNIIFSSQFEILVVHDKQVIYKYPLPESDLVEGFKVTGGNILWVITRTSGLLVFRIQPDVLENYLVPIYKFKKELQNYSPRCMGFDKNGLIWIGTRDHGILAFRFTGKELLKWQHYDTQKGLTDNYVNTITCDSSNNILVGTQTGIDRLVIGDNNEYRVENITKSNNVFGFVNKLWVNKNGDAYALQNSGAILQFSPVQATASNYKPQLFIEEIKVNGNRIQNNDYTRLRYNQRNLTFNVAAPTFIDEKQVKYSYRLSGNSVWSEPSSNANINLLNLNPGEYVLSVKALFPSTSYSPKEISFAFSITPPWWETWWFRISMGLMIIGLLLLFVRTYYRRKLVNQLMAQEKQQAIEKERTRIATDMHDDLGAGLSRVKFLSETIGIKKQQQLPFEEDIISIRQYSQEMINKMGEIVWALNERNDSLSDLLAYTRSYAVEYLLQNGITCDVEAPEYFPSSFVSGEFRRNIYLVVKEALHNIVKHAQANHVSIRIFIRKDLTISIHDNGIGIDAKHARPFSNGILNMQKRMNSMGGILGIKNEQGTTISLSVPIS